MTSIRVGRNQVLASSPAASRRVGPSAVCHAVHDFKRHTCHVNHQLNLSSADLRSPGFEVHPVPTTSTSHQQPQPANDAIRTSRRDLVLGVAAVALALQPRAARADEEVKLPKEYRQMVKRLSEGLSESIESEASGASEAEVRRKADPAKDSVREFVRKWRDNPRVSSDQTHAEIKEALAELGEFYLAYGQRTKLTPPVRESVLRHLAAARGALPQEPTKEGSGLMGLF